MSTNVKVFLAGLAGVLLVSVFAWAGSRPAGELSLLLKLNGEPVVVGHVRITDAGVVTNANTQFPFTLTGGQVYEAKCNTAACLRFGVAPDGGAVVTCNYQDDNVGTPMTAGASRWFTLQDNTSTVYVVPNATSSTDCSIAVMR